MESSTKVSVPEVSRSDIDWINRRLDRQDRKLRIIISLLVEKHLIGDTLLKAIEESKSEDELIDWLMNEVNKS